MKCFRVNSKYSILPDDTSRLRLSFIPGVEGSDYINANYIDVSVL